MQANESTSKPSYWWQQDGPAAESCSAAPEPGQTCPICRQGRLAYDSLFILTCKACGYVAEGGAFT